MYGFEGFLSIRSGDDILFGKCIQDGCSCRWNAFANELVDATFINNP
jgi:hypothetical protein